MTIADKLITIADNTPAVAEAVKATKATATGTDIRVDDVLDIEHPLSVRLKSKNLITTLSVDAEADKNKVLFEGSVTGDFVFSCLFNYTECKTPTAAQFEFTVDGAIQYMARGSETNKMSKKLSGTLTKIRYLNWGYGVGTVENLQLEVGTTVTEYAPHITDFAGKEVKVFGKNLFKVQDFIDYANSVSQGNPTNTYLGEPCFSYSNYRNADGSVVMPFNGKPNTRYTLSCECSFSYQKYETYNSMPVCYIRYSDNTSESIVKTMPSDSFTPVTFTTNANKTVVGIGISKFSSGCTIYVKNMQFEVGTGATNYEEYKEPQTSSASSDGKVDGLKSISPIMNAIAGDSGCAVVCEYFPQSASDTFTKYRQLKACLTNLKASL